MGYFIEFSLLVGITSVLGGDGTHPKCLSKAGDQANNIRNWSFNDSKKLKCYYQCLLISENIIPRQGGELNGKNYFKLFNTEELQANADNCLDYKLVSTAHQCDGAYEIFKCNYNANPAEFKKSMIAYFDNKGSTKKSSKKNKKSKN
uniref:Odorant-binding protein n=1 Tax=Simulium nigrimanum TaxID=683695 RepID=D1FPW0_SIMNI